MRVWLIVSLFPAIIATVFTTGCRAGSHADEILADGAGGRIIHVSWDDARLLQVHPEPDLVIGEPGGIVDLDLYRIGGLAVPRAEVVLVSEVSTQQVIRVDLGSGNVTRFGRSGDGPLEFRALSRPFPNTSGALFLFDSRRRRLLEVTEHGELLQEIRVPEVGTASGTLLLVPAGPVQLETLYLAVFPGFSSEPSARPYRGQGALVRLIDPADTLVVFRGAEVFTSSTSTGGVMFGASTLIAGSEEGIWLGDTSNQAVDLWTPEHGLTKTIRWTTTNTRVLTESRIAEFWSRIALNTPPEQHSAFAEMRRAMPFADSIPAFGSLVAAAGAVWIGAYGSPEVELLGERLPAKTWLVVDHNGGEASRVVTPAGFTLRLATENHIFGVYRDSLGVETIRRYRFGPPP